MYGFTVIEHGAIKLMKLWTFFLLFCVFYTGNGYGWAWPPTWDSCLYSFRTPHIPRLLSAKSLNRWHYH